MKASIISALCGLLLVLYVGRQVRGAPSTYLSGNTLVLNGKANIQYYEAKERLWAGLSNGHRYPIIKSGDKIALKMSYTSGSNHKYYMRCTTSYCYRDSCPGDTVFKSNKWSSCSYDTFYINAIGKSDGQPINSGDMVYISSGYYSRSYRLRCTSSTSWKCRLTSISESYFKGNNWFGYSYAIFQIFSRRSVDGTPVQYGDIVGFRYPYYYAYDWLYYNGGYWYARSCSYNNKNSCARTNYPTGFQIFKYL
ncbi:uncharacterized protein LOC116603474 [Nematostella vectensis]|uniref:uncharacterized protein LOC116603474 n=1 Tax=Nematostella vectensis TaxID=45351 RepID=UPI002076E58A|nr:uncharacterized protein LOC116603474 [Nematostella vectensis]